MQNLTDHEGARALALEAASRIIADTDPDFYTRFGYTTDQTDARRSQATVTMAHEFYRFIMYGDTEVSG